MTRDDALDKLNQARKLIAEADAFVHATAIGFEADADLDEARAAINRAAHAIATDDRAPLEEKGSQ